MLAKKDRNETEKLPQNCYNYNNYQSAVSQENVG